MFVLKHLHILLFSFILFACGNSNSTPVLKQVEMSIEGMSCAHSCAPAIQEKVSEIPGVKEVKVDFNSKKAVVKYNENVTNINEIKSTIETFAEGAYSVTSVK